jgi:tRNA 2-thiouridine synthesizing protein A
MHEAYGYGQRPPPSPITAVVLLPEGVSMSETIAKTLDAKNLNCPLPILKAKKALQELPKGGVLEVLATDPGAVADFEAFCRLTKNTLLEHAETAGVYRFLIKHTS